jgi:hypothetical protein
MENFHDLRHLLSADGTHILDHLSALFAYAGMPTRNQNGVDRL